MRKYIAVIGLGSIGKRYVKKLNFLNYEVLGLDKKKFKNEKNNFYFNNKNFFLKECKRLKCKFVIISTLSDSHYYYLKLVLNSGFKKILLEKPISNNYFNALKILRLSKNNNVFLGTHYKWNILKFSSYLRRIENKYKTGKVLFFNIFGGANCISTGGMHWIDFVLDHLDMKKKNFEINANINSKKINPRSKKFNYIDGLLNLSFKKNTFLNLIFSNKSRLVTNVQIVYKHYFINLKANGKIEISRTSKNLDNKPITRYDIPKLINSTKFKNLDSETAVLKNLIFNKKPLLTIDDSFISYNTIISSLISASLNKKIKIKEIKKYANTMPKLFSNLKLT